ncbi:MAG: hypothetical protein WA958_02655 [Tunicatimonas sp.]
MTGGGPDDSFKDPGIVNLASKANDRPNNPGERTSGSDGSRPDGSRPDGSGLGAPPEDEAPF